MISNAFGGFNPTPKVNVGSVLYARRRSVNKNASNEPLRQAGIRSSTSRRPTRSTTTSPTWWAPGTSGPAITSRAPIGNRSRRQRLPAHEPADPELLRRRSVPRSLTFQPAPGRNPRGLFYCGRFLIIPPLDRPRRSMLWISTEKPRSIAAVMPIYEYECKRCGIVSSGS